MVATDSIDWVQEFQRQPSSGVVVKRTFIEVVDAQRHDDQLLATGLQRRACSDPLIYDRPDVLQNGPDGHAEEEDSDFELNGLSDEEYDPEDSQAMVPCRLEAAPVEGQRVATLLPRCPHGPSEKEEICRLWAANQVPVVQATGHGDPRVDAAELLSDSNTATQKKEALHHHSGISDSQYHQHQHHQHHQHHHHHYNRQHAECEKEQDSARHCRHGGTAGIGPVMGKTRSLPTALPTTSCKTTPTLLASRALLSSSGIAPAQLQMGILPELTSITPQSTPLSKRDIDYESSGGSKCDLQRQHSPAQLGTPETQWAPSYHYEQQHLQQRLSPEHCCQHQFQQQHQSQLRQAQAQAPSQAASQAPSQAQLQSQPREMSDLESLHSFAHLESVSQGGTTERRDLEMENSLLESGESASHSELRRLMSENTRLSLENRLLRENMRLARENRMLGGPGSWVEGDSREASERGQSPVQKVSSVSSIEAGAPCDVSPFERSMRAAAAAAKEAATSATAATAAPDVASDAGTLAPKVTRGCTATQRRRRDRQRKKEEARKAAAAAGASAMAAGENTEATKDTTIRRVATSNGSSTKATKSTAVASPVPEAKRTTVMLRNLPNNYTRAMVMTLLDSEGFQGLYDFLYLPVDFKSRACLGYAFVNLVDETVVPLFWAKFDGYKQWAWASRKVCRVTWSGPQQGLAAHLERYRNSPVMHSSVPEEFQPVYLQGGVRMQFPPPVKAPRAPRIRNPLNRVSPVYDVPMGGLVDGATSSF